MAVDTVLLHGVETGSAPSTIRVYAWDPPAVSLGHAQDPASELDLDECGRRGYGVVVRPTGGRAVLHAGELTYSVVGRAAQPPLGGSIAQTYEAVARGLLAGLARLGVDAELAPVSTGRRSRGEPSPPCFVSAGRFEITVDGLKLVGSAQRRTGDSVLQHGSLLLDGTHAGLADIVGGLSRSRRAALRKALEERTTDLSSVLGRRVSFGEVASALRLGFEKAWEIDLVPGGLSERESRAVSESANEYRTVS
jgi:lipoate-protein ligase A